MDSDITSARKPRKAIGSVLFFKRLILAFITLITFSLIFACVMLKIQNFQLRADTARLQLDIESVQIKLNAIKEAEAAAKAETEAKAAAIGIQNPTPVTTIGSAVSGEALSYQLMFPDLYCDPQVSVALPDKTLFLTFDDGPSENTVKVLDVLKKHGISATFFVAGGTSKRSTELIQRIVAEGHSLGVHTYTHNYEAIYASVEDYLTDFKKEYDLIYSATGVKPSIFRFPGGSINSYDRSIYQQLIAEMTRRGFTYYDWSISSGDGASTTTAAAFKANILSGADKLGKGIVLMHDSISRTNTVGILDEVIVELIHRGYKFASINNKVMPVTFLYIH